MAWTCLKRVLNEDQVNLPTKRGANNTECFMDDTMKLAVLEGVRGRGHRLGAIKFLSFKG